MRTEERVSLMSKSFRVYVGLALCGLLLYAASSTVSPVAASPDSCPIVSIRGVRNAENARMYSLAADINGGDPARTPAFKWCISHGKITNGRDTSAVVIDFTGVTEEVVTVTVIVSNMAPLECDNVDVYKIKAVFTRANML